MTMDSGPTSGPIAARPVVSSGPLMTMPLPAGSTTTTTTATTPAPNGAHTLNPGVVNGATAPRGQHLCHGCGKRIGDRFLLKALDVFWHEDCLKCGCCDCRLGEVGSSLYTKANLILCKRDYLSPKMTMDSGPTSGPIAARPVVSSGPLMTMPLPAGSTTTTTTATTPAPNGAHTLNPGVVNGATAPRGQHLCHGCGKRIGDRFLLKALDVFWHEDCLKCGCCDCRLGEVGSSLYTKANLILCKRDYL
ncbi:unnamed protein product, partial [Notodromas monacha]